MESSKVGANPVAELRSFSIEETADTVEDTVMTDTARSFITTLTSFTGSADVYWDETDSSGQGALTIGASVTIGFYPGRCYQWRYVLRGYCFGNWRKSFV